MPPLSTPIVFFGSLLPPGGRALVKMELPAPRINLTSYLLMESCSFSFGLSRRAPQFNRTDASRCQIQVEPPTDPRMTPALTRRIYHAGGQEALNGTSAN